MQEYSRKRNFTRTPEPAPLLRAGEGPLSFFIHKHAARHLHYDLRLEVDGVLKSWALPHGPSLDPEDKRLAIMVEDHPLDYGSFEGVIPEGEYGAGQVIVWDKGTYSPERFDKFYFDSRTQSQRFAREGIEKGKLKFYLRGAKLQGIWTLVKMQNRGKNNWLLIKHQDEFTNPERDISRETYSVISGLSIADLKAGRLPNLKPAYGLNLENVSGARKNTFPNTIEPMLATVVEAPFSDPAWIFEPKLDGYRTIAFIRNGEVKLVSRRGLDVTKEYAYLKGSLENQTATDMILDGEVIALDKRGKSCFQCLQNYLSELHEVEVRHKPVQLSIIYYVFDIIYLNSYLLTEVPLRQRRRLLESTLKTDDRVRLVEQFSGDGEIVYQAAIDNGLEGVIAKRLDSIYETGRRSGNWLKIKSTLSDEFVVGGYSEGRGNRAHTFGALLLGQYDDKRELVYNGRVGTGFDEDNLKIMLRKLHKLETKQCPFVKVPPLNAPTTWVKPQVVIEVKFSQWTNDGILRTPVFSRIREDKSAKEIHHSKMATVPVLTTIIEKKLDKTNDPVPKQADVLKQLNESVDKIELQVEQQNISLNNLDKVLWPATHGHTAYTKRDLIIYLVQVSDYLLPHLKDRPLSLSRYPDGINGEHFYQKHWGHPLPKFVKTIPITTEHEGTKEYMVCNNLATLMWLGQIADIELHTWFSRIVATPDRPPDKDDSPNAMVRYPDFIIFDLDPYIYSGEEKGGAEPELNRRAFAKVCEVSLWLKEILDKFTLTAFVKTSGQTGLHLYVPIKRQFNYDEVRSISRTICTYVHQNHPQETTIEWTVEKRSGKVFLDYNQNIFGKTLASIFSPRPNREALVSTPLNWNELGKVYPADFTIKTLPERLKTMGDIWADIMDAKQDLKKLIT